MFMLSSLTQLSLWPFGWQRGPGCRDRSRLHAVLLIWSSFWSLRPPYSPVNSPHTDGDTWQTHNCKDDIDKKKPKKLLHRASVVYQQHDNQYESIKSGNILMQVKLTGSLNTMFNNFEKWTVFVFHLYEDCCKNIWVIQTYLWKFLSVSSKWRRISSAHSVDGAPEILSLMLFRSCFNKDCNSASSSADRWDISTAGQNRAIGSLWLSCANVWSPCRAAQGLFVWVCFLYSHELTN